MEQKRVGISWHGTVQVHVLSWHIMLLLGWLSLAFSRYLYVRLYNLERIFEKVDYKSALN